MSETGLIQILEGALLAAGKPMTVAQLGNVFEEPERPDSNAIREALQEIEARCEDRGFELKEVSSGFRFQVRQNLSPWISRLSPDRPQRYSRALLETLALVAYRQPITRGEIEEIRGVAVSSNIIKTLHEREWIRVVGHRDVPGRPAMYATTKQFLDYFNLKSLDQLPALAEIRDLETLNAELGFSEPVREGDDDPKEVVPELTVVGGTEHVQEDSASAGEQLPDEPAEAMAELRGELRAELRAEAPEHDVTALPSESSQANAGLAEDAPLDTQALEEQGISLDEAVEDLESRAVEPVEQDLESLATASAEDAAPEADRFEEPAPKPESQA